VCFRCEVCVIWTVGRWMVSTRVEHVVGGRRIGLRVSCWTGAQVVVGSVGMGLVVGISVRSTVVLMMMMMMMRGVECTARMTSTEMLVAARVWSREGGGSSVGAG
jgi:hypothetical protein